MKKVLPFIFPAAALLLVLILAVRWYRLSTQTVPAAPEFAEGVEIENLSQTELDRVLRGTDDFKKVDLQPEPDQTEIIGEVRYEVVDGKVAFTVMADLPILDQGVYQVWLKDTQSDSMRKAFVLEFMKGGYTGSAAISTEALPFEVIVSREMTDDATLENVLLRGTIQEEKVDEATDSAEVTQ